MADDVAAARFDTLPAEAIARVADLLASTDHLALQAVQNHHVAHSIERHAQAADIEHRHAPLVHDLADLVALIGHPGAAAGTIASLPPELQASPLSAVAMRVPALPPQDLGPATQAFLAYPYRGPANARLAELRQAASEGDMGLVHRELALARPGGEAHQAVRAGQHLGQVAAIHGIVGPDAIGHLRAAALQQAQQQVALERHVPTVAREAGLDRPEDRAELDRFAAMNTAPAMLDRGIAPEAVIAHLGIVDPNQRLRIERAAARRDVALGMDVQTAVQRHGVGGDVWALEITAMTPGGVAAVGRGEGTVREVAARLGIVSDRGIASFEDAVVRHHGETALNSGASVETVARQFGLQLPQSLAHLMVYSGAEPEAVIDQWGIEGLQQRRDLRHVAARRDGALRHAAQGMGG